MRPRLGGVDVDKLLGALVTSRPSSSKPGAAEPSRASEHKIELLLRLRKLVRALPALCAALRDRGALPSLLSTARQVFKDERHEAMAILVDQTINDDAVGGLGKGPLAARNARLFAVKAERKRLLEVARATYLENVSDLNELLSSLKEQHQLPSLALHYSSSGYMLQADRQVSHVRWSMFLTEGKGSSSFTGVR